MTDGKSIDAVVNEVAEKAHITLRPDRRCYAKKLWDRGMILLNHIR